MRISRKCPGQRPVPEARGHDHHPLRKRRRIQARQRQTEGRNTRDSDRNGGRHARAWNRIQRQDHGQEQCHERGAGAEVMQVPFRRTRHACRDFAVDRLGCEAGGDQHAAGGDRQQNAQRDPTDTSDRNACEQRTRRQRHRPRDEPAHHEPADAAHRVLGDPVALDSQVGSEHMLEPEHSEEYRDADACDRQACATREARWVSPRSRRAALARPGSCRVAGIRFQNHPGVARQPTMDRLSSPTQ